MTAGTTNMASRPRSLYNSQKADILSVGKSQDDSWIRLPMAARPPEMANVMKLETGNSPES
eukprot:CAMPEP_0170625956 /NCGR_PEP_ID=MMETSP0224-20130122/31066_1 /TAXON_ID=285029 /ORGANISM="Togula jolla, Strain CCCM 725" /LENGTH=60 /DNA_ID=CAMNT_0010952627 /DNA_START=160 /DNA_END=339 /DNA_ORIENTATION=+